MKRIVYACILLLLLASCNQANIRINGRVTGYYAEAETSYDTYNGYLVNGSALFQWRNDWNSVNTAHDRVEPLKCDFTQIDNWQKAARQNCTRRYFLTVTFDNGLRFCEVTQVAWLTVAVGQYVAVFLTAKGELECNP